MGSGTSKVLRIALGLGLVAAAGCAKDPKVIVTPFVLKPPAPQVQVRDMGMLAGIEAMPGTRAYEEEVLSLVFALGEFETAAE